MSTTYDSSRDDRRDDEDLERCHSCGSTNLEHDLVPPGPPCPQTGYVEDMGDEVHCLDCGADYIVEAA